MATKKPVDERYRDALNENTPAMKQVLDIANAAHVSIPTAREWVSGRRRPSASAMALLSIHYGIKEDKLFSPGHFDNVESKSKN